MKRRKRFTIRLVALGLAVTGFAAPAALAGPLDVSGTELRTVRGDDGIVSPDDRVIHATSPQRILSPDDRSVHATWTPPQPVTASDGDGFGLGTVAMSGIVLLLAGGAAGAVALRQSRKGKLATA